MNKLSKLDIIRLCANSQAARNTLSKMASKQGGFNEDPQMHEEGMPDQEVEQQQHEYANEQPHQESVPQDAEQHGGGEPTPEEYAIEMAHMFLGQELMEAAMSGDPEAKDLVARTAGHVATSMASSYASSYHQDSQYGDEQGVEPGNEYATQEGQAVDVAPGDDVVATPAGEVQPEQNVVADAIVPNPGNHALVNNNAQPQQAQPQQSQPQQAQPQQAQPPQGQPPQGQPQPSNNIDEPVTVKQSTLAKLIILAKAGKI